jgi:hypothetical protein|tara:strand:- start:260 stop:649 length:390 start_codon:yes stop_codon:yes gene_type:complete
MMKEQSGLMPKQSKAKTATPKLDALRQQFQPKAVQSLEEQLAGLAETELNSVKTQVQMVSLVYDPLEQRSYATHVEKMYPRAKTERKQLVVRLMQELMPEREYIGVEQPYPDYQKAFYDRADMQLREQP